jgi:hypothetical protein
MARLRLAEDEQKVRQALSDAMAEAGAPLIRIVIPRWSPCTESDQRSGGRSWPCIWRAV